MASYAIDEFCYNTIDIDGVKVKITCATRESIPPRIFIGAKEVRVYPGEEIRIVITYSSEEDASYAEKAAQEWCRN